VNGLRFGAMFEYVLGSTFDFAINTPFGAIPARSVSWIPIQHYSAEYVWKSLTLQAEYNILQISSDTITPMGTTHEVSPHENAWFVSAAYRFNKWIEAGTYYTEYYNNTADRDGSLLATPSDGYQKDWAFLSLRFDLTDWCIFKVEGHHIRGTALLRDDAHNPNRNGDGWFMFAAKTTFSF
jgi:hypothetical protein